jgi:hypothetical protein
MGLDYAVGIATGYGLEDRGVGVRVPVGLIIFSASSKLAEAYQTSYSMGIGGSFPRGKAAGAWS